MDVRGICSTSNALANHGFISGDDITNIAEIANAVQTDNDFDFSLSFFLSALRLMVEGNFVTAKYTIGGADPRVSNTLGTAEGVKKREVFEIDGTTTRKDVNVDKNATFFLQR